MPRTPSLLTICSRLLIMMLPLAPLLSIFGNPWTCNLVLITSNGQTKVAAMAPAEAPAAAWQRSPLVVRLWVSVAIEGIRAEDGSIEAGAPTENLDFLSREGRSGDPASHGLESQNQGAPRKDSTGARRIEQQEEDQIRVPIGTRDCGATPLSEGLLLPFLHLLLTSLVGCFQRRLSHDARRGDDWIRKRHWSLDSIPTAAGKS